ncbi:N-acylneuraminate cytidylyltransferase [Rhodobacter aestuarii]|uniref:N-acylneuraminate cytidylyltransferase n=1 Tax=Rhodobacter aestuarii TaxID=453582 RepID=A0A1N7Q9E1_9RHOB|nr:acylneuraminate cytidylyltransferase family protein [Rhodobacter aestuarii]PTV93779.1 N-acylneuraminate cytidylyltransferase [Rhodobacter aestuarii]SIT19480.1 N-acylneuraminate cytidylyltransferase [Rhodobacter aestuarii]
MILGHIGARKGSKGVPGKNFRMIAGKPLIDWSLDLLFESDQIGAVVVSTDDERIYDHAVAKGALDIGLRPAHLATDSAPKWGVWQHALEAAQEKLGQPVTAFVDLDCTAPLRLAEDLTNAIALFQSQKPDMVMSVCEARKNPYFNLVEADEAGALHVSKPLPGGVWSRQTAPKVWEHAASTYVLDPDYLRRAKTIYEGRVIPFEMPAERCLDIDSPLDFKLVEMLMAERHSPEATQ